MAPENTAKNDEQLSFAHGGFAGGLTGGGVRVALRCGAANPARASSAPAPPGRGEGGREKSAKTRKQSSGERTGRPIG